ncbi:hypothetical protein [Flagellimonas marina]
MILSVSCRDKKVEEIRKEEPIVSSKDTVRQGTEVIQEKIDCNKYVTSKGLIQVDLENLRVTGDSLKILNKEGQFLGSIFENEEEEIVSPINRRGFRAFYDDYDILYIDSDGLNSNNSYDTKIDCNKYEIGVSSLVKYYSWDEFLINKAFLKLNEDSPLYFNKSDKSEIVEIDYHYFSFEVILVEGNWVKVKCSKDCEGCGESQKEITGWVKWKNEDNEILVYLYYSC